MAKKMNGIYIAPHNKLLSDDDQYEKSSRGIEKKIYMQYNFFKRFANMEFFDPYANNKLKTKLLRRVPYFPQKWGNEVTTDGSINFVYIRKSDFIDEGFFNYVKQVKNQNKNCKILLEIPTFPYDGEQKNVPFYNKILIWKDKVLRKQLYKYIDRIVTYSDDNYIFNIKTINTSNGIRLDDVPNSLRRYSKKVLNVMICANLNFWHGYDRAILGLHNYYKNGGERKIILHIVGDGNEKAKYEKMTKDFSLEKNIIFYGAQYGENLNRIYQLCDVAFDSMGRHRSGVKYNSSLKGKEYIARGLPIVSGVKTDLDDKNYKYYYRVPADDTPVNFNNVVAFCDEIYLAKDSEKIHQTIRKYAQKNFSYETVMEPIGNYLLNNKA